MPASDQYVKLEEERRQRQRLEKGKTRRRHREKGKRGRVRLHSSLHESDEDIAPAQRVDIVTEEMPEVGLPAVRADLLPTHPPHPCHGRGPRRSASPSRRPPDRRFWRPRGLVAPHPHPF